MRLISDSKSSIEHHPRTSKNGRVPRFQRRNRRSTQSLPEQTLPNMIEDVPDRISGSIIDPNTGIEDKSNNMDIIETREIDEKIRSWEQDDNENKVRYSNTQYSLADSISHNSKMSDKYSIPKNPSSYSSNSAGGSMMFSNAYSTMSPFEQQIMKQMGKGDFVTPVGAIAGLRHNSVTSPNITINNYNTMTRNNDDNETIVGKETCPEDFINTMLPSPPSRKLNTNNHYYSTTPSITNDILDDMKQDCGIITERTSDNLCHNNIRNKNSIINGVLRDMKHDCGIITGTTTDNLCGNNNIKHIARQDCNTYGDIATDCTTHTGNNIKHMVKQDCNTYGDITRDCTTYTGMSQSKKEKHNNNNAPIPKNSSEVVRDSFFGDFIYSLWSCK